MDKDLRCVSAATFKAKCLRLMDEVAERREPILITKRGKPIAKLVPVDRPAMDPFGCMAGTARICGDIVGPTGESWTGDAENL